MSISSDDRLRQDAAICVHIILLFFFLLYIIYVCYRDFKAYLLRKYCKNYYELDLNIKLKKIIKIKKKIKRRLLSTLEIYVFLNDVHRVKR